MKNEPQSIPEARIAHYVKLGYEVVNDDPGKPGFVLVKRTAEWLKSKFGQPDESQPVTDSGYNPFDPYEPDA